MRPKAPNVSLQVTQTGCVPPTAWAYTLTRCVQFCVTVSTIDRACECTISHQHMSTDICSTGKYGATPWTLIARPKHAIATTISMRFVFDVAQPPSHAGTCARILGKVTAGLQSVLQCGCILPCACDSFEPNAGLEQCCQLRAIVARHPVMVQWRQALAPWRCHE